MDKKNYNLGDIVEMKKEHPCETRSKRWVITRMGADIKIKCLGCNTIVMLSRHSFEKSLKKIIEKAGQE